MREWIALDRETPHHRVVGGCPHRIAAWVTIICTAERTGPDAGTFAASLSEIAGWAGKTKPWAQRFLGRLIAEGMVRAVEPGVYRLTGWGRWQFSGGQKLPSDTSPDTVTDTAPDTVTLSVSHGERKGISTPNKPSDTVTDTVTDTAPDTVTLENQREKINDNGGIGAPRASARGSLQDSINKTQRTRALAHAGTPTGVPGEDAQDTATHQNPENELDRASEQSMRAQSTPIAPETAPEAREGVAPMPAVREGGETRNRGKCGRSGLPSPDRAVKEGYPAQFEAFWTLYPRRSGGNPKKGAYRRWVRYSAEDRRAIETAARQYADQCAKEGKAGTPYVQQASTWLGPDEHWREWAQGPDAPASTDDSAWRRSELAQAFGDWGLTPEIKDRIWRYHLGNDRAPSPDLVRDWIAHNGGWE